MKRRIMGLWIACICTVSFLFTGTVSGAEVIHETDLEKYILEEMSAAHVLGMSISIVSPDKELYCAAYGQAQNTDVDYVLGGITKSLTATAVLHMAEVKDLKLHDTVADYLPEYQAVGDVTLRELLYQTSGIAPEESMSDLQGLGTRGEFADANANYNLLGMIIEKVSNISYEEYISDTILDTLGMESTYSMRNDTGTTGTLLPAYQGYFGFPFAVQYKYDTAEDWMQVPSGQMISDVKDMGNYLQLLLNNGGILLLGDSVEQLLYGDVAVPDTDGIMFGGSASAGMGWLKKEIDGQTILYSTGVTENYNTAMVLLPEKELGIVMMFNSTDFIVGQKLINTLQEGIVSIELEKDTEQIDRQIYLMWHAISDVIMVLLVLAAWMPILLMGVWCKHRRGKLFSIPGIIMDILVQLALPTGLILVLCEKFPLFLIKRMTPDIFYVGMAVILTLYLGAVIKVIAMIILKLLPPLKEEPTAAEETTVTDETAATEMTSKMSGTVKAATTRAKRDRMLETVRTGVLEKEDMVTGKAEDPLAKMEKRLKKLDKTEEGLKKEEKNNAQEGEKESPIKEKRADANGSEKNNETKTEAEYTGKQKNAEKQNEKTEAEKTDSAESEKTQNSKETPEKTEKVNSSKKEEGDLTSKVSTPKVTIQKEKAAKSRGKQTGNQRKKKKSAYKKKK